MKLISLILTLLLSYASLILSRPDLGIRQDPYINPVDGSRLPLHSYHSYTGIIKFQDASIPGDRDRLSDGQLINFAKLAYDEMVTIWQGLQLSPGACPGAMAVLESNGHLFFASSVKMAGSQFEIKDIDAEKEGSPGWFLTACLRDGMGTHMRGGQCAEPNVLRLFGDYAKTADNDRYVAPEKTRTSPRVAVWGRLGNQNPLENRETYFPPCHDQARGWGCVRFKDHYGLKPAASVPRDPEGENEWQFGIVNNPRSGECNASK